MTTDRDRPRRRHRSAGLLVAALLAVLLPLPAGGAPGAGPGPAAVGGGVAAADPADHDVLAFGAAPFHGSPAALGTEPVVGVATAPGGDGYWVAAVDGGVFSFGDAAFAGSAGGLPLNAPIVGIAPDPDGQGYWLAAADGGVFAYDAPFAGSAGDLPLNAPIVGMASPAAAGTAGGYWLVAADGGVLSFGAAPFHGSAAGADLGRRSVIGMAARPGADGYWLALGRRPIELPWGGRTIFPGHRAVAYYGSPASPALGVLGSGPLDQVADRLLRQADAYRGGGLPVVPVFELIASLATAAPGADGDHSSPLDDAAIQRHLDAVRRIGGLLVLDLQPGQGDFLSAARRFERFLAEPDVGLALDPEWRMPAGVAPGDAIGSVEAAEVNAVSAWLADLVARHDLPQKVLIVHQFREAMVRDRADVVTRPGLALVFHADGFGSAAAKRSKYAALHGTGGAFSGFKLFYDRDLGLMSPADVLGMEPPPDFVSYQ